MELNKPTLLALPKNWFSFHVVCYKTVGDASLLSKYQWRTDLVSPLSVTLYCLGYSSIDQEVFKFEIQGQLTPTTPGRGATTSVYIPIGSSKLELEWPLGFHVITSSKTQFTIKKRNPLAKYFSGTIPLEELQAFAESLTEDGKTVVKCVLLETLTGEKTLAKAEMDKFQTAASIKWSDTHAKFITPFTLETWKTFSQGLSNLSLLNKGSVFGTLQSSINSGEFFGPKLPSILGEALLSNLQISDLYRGQELPALVTNLSRVRSMSQTQTTYKFFDLYLLGNLIASLDPTIAHLDGLKAEMDLWHLDLAGDTVTFTTTEKVTTGTPPVVDTANLSSLLLMYYVSNYGSRIANLAAFSVMRKIGQWMIDTLQADPTAAFQLHVNHFGSSISSEARSHYKALSLAEALFYLSLGAKLPESILDYATRSSKDKSIHQLVGAYSAMENLTSTNEPSDVATLPA